jgi:hypothetical protein
MFRLLSVSEGFAHLVAYAVLALAHWHEPVPWAAYILLLSSAVIRLLEARR